MHTQTPPRHQRSPEASEAGSNQGDGGSRSARPGPEPGTGVDATELSLTERLAFERLLGDLSARFADLPADQVIDQLKRALERLMDFLGFDRCSFAESSDTEGPFQILCSVSRPGIEIMAPGPTPPICRYFTELRAGRIVVLTDIPGDFPPEASVEREYCERVGFKSNLAIPCVSAAGWSASSRSVPSVARALDRRI